MSYCFDFQKHNNINRIFCRDLCPKKNKYFKCNRYCCISKYTLNKSTNARISHQYRVTAVLGL